LKEKNGDRPEEEETRRGRNQETEDGAEEGRRTTASTLDLHSPVVGKNELRQN